MIASRPLHSLGPAPQKAGVARPWTHRIAKVIAVALLAAGVVTLTWWTAPDIPGENTRILLGMCFIAGSACIGLASLRERLSQEG